MSTPIPQVPQAKRRRTRIYGRWWYQHKYGAFGRSYSADTQEWEARLRLWKQWALGDGKGETEQ